MTTRSCSLASGTPTPPRFQEGSKQHAISDNACLNWWPQLTHAVSVLHSINPTWVDWSGRNCMHPSVAPPIQTEISSCPLIGKSDSYSEQVGPQLRILVSALRCRCRITHQAVLQLVIIFLLLTSTFSATPSIQAHIHVQGLTRFKVN